jgi:hypothetical protein
MLDAFGYSRFFISGGKSFIAELVALKTVICVKKKAIFVLPYVSLVIEKEKHFKQLLRAYNRIVVDEHEKVRVRSVYGENAAPRRYREQILLCTIEKANTIVNGLIANGKGIYLTLYSFCFTVYFVYYLLFYLCLFMFILFHCG